jgi:glutaredoxin 3
MAKVEIYVQDFCPYCARAVSLFQKKGVPFEEIYAPHGSAARQQAIERSGGRTTVPQVFVDGRHIGGSDDLLALDRKGGLDPLLAG